MNPVGSFFKTLGLRPFAPRNVYHVPSLGNGGLSSLNFVQRMSISVLSVAPGSKLHGIFRQLTQFGKNVIKTSSYKLEPFSPI